MDRRQEIVIGQDLDKEALTKKLDEYLLTEEEIAVGIDKWMEFKNPFPPIV